MEGLNTLRADGYINRHLLKVMVLRKFLSLSVVREEKRIISGYLKSYALWAFDTGGV
jgi:hypothetical protein